MHTKRRKKDVTTFKNGKDSRKRIIRKSGTGKTDKHFCTPDFVLPLLEEEDLIAKEYNYWNWSGQ